MKRILVTTDFSDESKKALPYAASLAGRFGAEIHLLNVLEPAPRLVGFESLELLQGSAATLGRAQRQLRALAKSTFRVGSKTTTQVRSGQPFRVITRAARDHDADLIIMATHGFTGLKHAFLGSTTERVIRHAPCPVLAVRSTEAKSSQPTRKVMPLRRIVLATDFSENARRAFRLAHLLADEFGAALSVLHVIEPFHADWHLDTGNLQRERRRQAQEQLQALIAGEFAGSVKAKAEVRAGHPVEGITRFARKSGADLIILATLGRTGLRRVLVGSVAGQVVRHAHCPVLVVRGQAR